MKAGNWKRRYSLAWIAALLSGCAGAPAPDRTPVNLSGFSTSFRQGYAEGCESAGARARRRNESRYQSDSDYKSGWNDGLSVCQGRR